MTNKTARFALPYRSLLLPVGLVLAGALAIRPLGAAPESAEISVPLPEQPAAIASVKTPTIPEPLELSSEESSFEAPVWPLRRLRKIEVTRDIALQAHQLIHEHHDKPFGTEIEFESNGASYVARIEEHYHPPGGEAKPWGKHPGVSVLVRRPLPTN